MIRLAPPVWDDTLAHLRRCGRGHAECVVLWTGPIDASGVVDAALHPEHTATGLHYRLDQRWLDRLHLGLLRERRTIRAQVHTHGGAAFHSATDDAYPAVNTAGFLSLVLPRFAVGAIPRADMWLAELAADGGWQQVRPDECIEGLPL